MPFVPLAALANAARIGRFGAAAVRGASEAIKKARAGATRPRTADIRQSGPKGGQLKPERAGDSVSNKAPSVKAQQEKQQGGVRT